MKLLEKGLLQMNTRKLLLGETVSSLASWKGALYLVTQSQTWSCTFLGDATSNLGGISNGKVINLRIAFKPTSTIGLMMDSIGVEEELMPNRNSVNILSNSEPESSPQQTRSALPTIPIRKLSRNGSPVLQEQTVVADSPESDDSRDICIIWL